MAAWLMAAFLNGLDDAEAAALTDAMLHSGTVLDPLGLARPQGGQALDRRRRRQGVARAGAARGRVRRARPDDLGPRVGPHRRDPRQAGGDPRLRRRPRRRPVPRGAGGDWRRAHRADRRDRAGRQKAVRAPRRDRDRRVDPPDRRVDPVEEAGRGHRRARARREGGPGRVHEDGSPRARAGGSARPRLARARDAGRGAVDRHGRAPRPGRRQRARDGRGRVHPTRRDARRRWVRRRDRGHPRAGGRDALARRRRRLAPTPAASAPKRRCATGARSTRSAGSSGPSPATPPSSTSRRA